MADNRDLFERMTALRWLAKGKPPIVLPFTRIVEGFHNRLAVRKRPYKPGAKIDSTGADPLGWTIDCLYHNGSEEPDLDANVYPDALNKACDILAIDETGTLELPTRGQKRCRLDSYERTEDQGARDCATLRLVFIEDSEDDFTAASFTAPSAASVCRRIAQEAVFSLSEAGALNGDIGDLLAMAAELEALANAPGDYADTLEQQVGAVVSRADRIEKAFTSTLSAGATEATALLTDPTSSRALRSVRALSDVARGALLRTTGLGRIGIRRYDREMSLFDVATLEGQDVARLLPLNPGIPVLRIPPRTPIRVPEAA